MPFDKDALVDEFARRVYAGEFDAEEKNDSEDDKASSGNAENSTIKAIRAEAKRAEKRAAAAEAEVAELRKFREETEAAAREARLQGAGLTKAQAAVFTKAFDDASDENIRLFKSEVLGLSEQAEVGGTPTGVFAPAGFPSENAPDITEGGAEVRDFVAKHGLEAAAKAFEEGKLKL